MKNIMKNKIKKFDEFINEMAKNTDMLLVNIPDYITMLEYIVKSYKEFYKNLNDLKEELGNELGNIVINIKNLGINPEKAEANIIFEFKNDIINIKEMPNKKYKSYYLIFSKTHFKYVLTNKQLLITIKLY